MVRKIMICVVLLVCYGQSALAEGRSTSMTQKKPIAPYGIPCVLFGLRQSWAEKLQNADAKPSSQRKLAVVCRLRDQYIDKDTGSRMCVYRKQGRGDEEEVVSLSPSLSCQRTYSCRDD